MRLYFTTIDNKSLKLNFLPQGKIKQEYLDSKFKGQKKKLRLQVQDSFKTINS